MVSTYPKIKLFVAMGASGSVAQSLGVDPKDKVACLDLESTDVAQVMASLDWGNPAPGESRLAISSLEEILTHAIEQASQLSGYGYSNLRAPVKQTFDQHLPGWSDSVDQGKEPESGQVWISASCNLEMHEIRSARRAGALLLAQHEQASMDMVATLCETFERLGATPKVSWIEGFSSKPSGQSKLPAWDWKMRSGAAYCLEAESKQLACAWVGSKGISALSRKPLGKAFGSWHAFALLSSIKPIRLVCGEHSSNRSYSSFSLKGDMDKTLFPCQIALASWGFRGKPGAKIEACEKALERVFGKSARISRVSESIEHPGSMRTEAVEDWLASVQAEIAANAIEKTLKSFESLKEKGAKRSTRL